MTIIYLGNQSGELVTSFYLEIDKHLKLKGNVQSKFIVWTNEEVKFLNTKGVEPSNISSFEQFLRSSKHKNHRNIEEDYQDINWSTLVAAERSFNDYSFLFGSVGERKENAAYIRKLLTNIVCFLENELVSEDILLTQTCDTIFTLVGLKLAKSIGMRTYSVAPAWLFEEAHDEGGLLVNDEFMRCNKLEKLYAKQIESDQKLSSLENNRVKALKNSVNCFDGKTKYFERTGKNSKTGVKALSPNFSQLISYVIKNHNLDKDLHYNKICFKSKIRANFLRLFRAVRNRKYMGKSVPKNLSEKFVFFGLHFQPEQTTLVQGLWYSNQISLIEDISKSLPMGYTLLVKEHPWGRGNRPAWQYEHLTSFYNVRLVDEPSKELIKISDAVIAISGTIAIESLIIGKPTIVLGQNTFTFCDLFYRPSKASDLPWLLKEVLVKKNLKEPKIINFHLDALLISYLKAIVPAYPLKCNADVWAHAIHKEIMDECS